VGRYIRHPAGPLTIIFGANSAGKSSIPQLLLMLKQTAESPDRNRALHFGDARTLVDLGLYKDVIHDHDTSNELEFQLRWQIHPDLQIEDRITGHRFDGDELEFSATLVGEDVPRVTQMNYKILKETEETLSLGLNTDKGSGENTS
jgi:hypothetical protein